MLDVENDTLLGLEIRILEHVFNEDDMECESTHDPHYNPVCSHEVVALSYGCDNYVMRICENCVKAYKAFKEGGGRCLTCQRPAAECWREVPI